MDRYEVVERRPDMFGNEIEVVRARNLPFLAATRRRQKLSDQTKLFYRDPCEVFVRKQESGVADADI